MRKFILLLGIILACVFVHGQTAFKLIDMKKQTVTNGDWVSQGVTGTVVINEEQTLIINTDQKLIRFSMSESYKTTSSGDTVLKGKLVSLQTGNSYEFLFANKPDDIAWIFIGFSEGVTDLYILKRL